MTFGLSLATAAAAGLGVPKGVWIGTAIAAGLCLVAAVVSHVHEGRPAGSAPASHAATAEQPRWSPPRALDRTDKAVADRSKIKNGENLLRLILEAELNPPMAFHNSHEIAFHNIGSSVEAWTRGLGLTEDVPRFSGDLAADLPRLKRIVQRGLEGLRSAQEQSQ